MSPAPQPSATAAGITRWERFSRSSVAGFHRYAEWLVGISWKKFFLLSILFLIAMAILSEIPPFSMKFTVTGDPVQETPATKASKAAKLKEKLGDGNIKIEIDDTGVHIKRDRRAPSVPPEAKGAHGPAVVPPEAPAQPAVPTPPDAPKSALEIGSEGVTIRVPREVAEELRAAVVEVEEGLRESADEGSTRDPARPRKRVVRLGGFLPDLALLLIVASMVIKIVYAGRVKAEVKAAAAQQTADAESLKRQVVEARMAAMQAQVEPHFLFNTLASIDHLIEVDPARASRMQKNLIAMLRASMPALRETETNLGRELAVVRPYLEILRVRMEDRLRTEVEVSEGLHSAEFPPMMLQSLVENAIKHGLEPKPEGGTLSIGAEVSHGKLAVTVADTGVGFGRAATAGTGVGLDNIRERLKLIYGGGAELRIAENLPCGTRVTIVVPYKAANGSSRA